MEEYEIQCVKWLSKQVLKAEASDPKLRQFKDRICELSIEIKSAQESEVPELVRQQDRVVQEFLSYVSNKSAG